MSTTISLILLNLVLTSSSDETGPILKEHLVRTDQYCPDLQESLRVKDIDTANYPYKSVFRLADHLTDSADPCIFEAKGPQNQITTVLIKAIHGDSQEWNYTGAHSCPEHIKLRLPSLKLFGDMRRPLCTVNKPPFNLSKTADGLFHHPFMWNLSKGRMGISFVSELDSNANSSFGNSTDPAVKDYMNHRLPKYLQIVFATFFGKTCSLRVQQYVADPFRDHCNSTQGRMLPTLCGMYECSEEEELLRRVGFFSESVRLHQLQKLLDYVRIKSMQRRDPTFMDFVVGLLRLLVMPMVFIVAYYVTRQLREKLASRQLMRHMRSLSQQSGQGRGSRGRLGSLMLDSPTNESRHHRYSDDPPPAYESVITPPNYHEATKLISSTERQEDDDVQKELSRGLLRHNVGSSSSLPSYSEISPTFVVDICGIDSTNSCGVSEGGQERISESVGSELCESEDNRNGGESCSGSKAKEVEEVLKIT